MSLRCTERELSFELLFKKGTGGVERASESSAFVFFPVHFSIMIEVWMSLVFQNSSYLCGP